MSHSEKRLGRDKDIQAERVEVIPKLHKGQIVISLETNKPDGSPVHTIVIQDFFSGDVLNLLETGVKTDETDEKVDGWVERLNVGDVVIQK